MPRSYRLNVGELWLDFSLSFSKLISKFGEGNAYQHSEEFILVTFDAFDEMQACNTIELLSDAALFYYNALLLQ